MTATYGTYYTQHTHSPPRQQFLLSFITINHHYQSSISITQIGKPTNKQKTNMADRDAHMEQYSYRAMSSKVEEHNVVVVVAIPRVKSSPYEQ
jgi:hypothetical protein